MAEAVAEATRADALDNKNSKSMEYGVAASVLFAGLNMNGKYLALTKKYCWYNT